MAEFALYSYFRSSASYRARIALHLKGIPFEYRPVHLLNNGGEQHKVEYRDINPAREVPTLIHNGRAIGQSMAILEYLDVVFPSPSLFPRDPYQASLVRQFCETVNCTQPMGNLRTLQYLEKEFRITEGQKVMWIDRWIGASFEALEKHLQKNSGNFCFGDQVTAADCFLVPHVFVAKRFHVSMANFPNVIRVNKNLEMHPAFQKAHPTKQIDYQG